MKSHYFFALVVFFVCACAAQPHKDIVKNQGLSTDALTIKAAPRHAQLTKSETHEYIIETADNHFIFGEVNQQSLNVKVQIFDPSGIEIQNINRTQKGIEHFTFDTQQTGKYRITVSAAENEVEKNNRENNTGGYTIQLHVNEPIANKPESRLKQLLIAYDNDYTPGVVAGIIEDGKISHSLSLGMANLAFDIPFQVNMPTNIGSVSKQFTAMGVLLLEQQGKLNLDDDIRKYLPELPDFGETITVKNLLNHTNGLREMFGLLAMRGWHGEDYIDKQQAIEIVQKQPKLQASPGEKMNYNNTAFVLLTHVVERITEQSFPVWMKDNVFIPLGMHSTYVRRDPGHIIHNATQGYDAGKHGYRETGDLYTAPGAGGIYTTAADMAKWSNNFNAKTLGGADVIEKLTTIGTLNSGEKLTYALGLGVEEDKGLIRYSHNGGDMAHLTAYMYYPEIKKGVFVNSNNATFSLSIADKIADLFFKQYFMEESEDNASQESKSDSVSLSTEQLDLLAGTFKSETLGLNIIMQATDKQLKMEFNGGGTTPLITQSNTEFTTSDGRFNISYHIESNKVAGLTVQAGGTDYEFEKLTLVEPSRAQLLEYTGRYFSDELEVLYTISVNQDDQLMLKLYGSPELKLTPTEKDVFSSLGFLESDLTFIRDESGKVIKVDVSDGRTQGVIFEQMP
ncbi:serine hydrolase domain-containing protein [Aliiglaciecola sp. NS0011-25]|uniref:serine hydrolase domain-containing protein n=1 Tax=Aliiglaciecola sp. NS0011-25 TaxID=3127654 RepID=UPI003101B98C